MATSSTGSGAWAQAGGSSPCVCMCERAAVASGPGQNDVRAGAWCRPGVPGVVPAGWKAGTQGSFQSAAHALKRVKQAVRVLSKLSFSCSARILKATLLFKQLRGLTFLMSDFRAEAPDMWLEALFP